MATIDDLASSLGLTIADVEAAVAARAKRFDAMAFRDKLLAKIHGQDQVIESITDFLRMRAPKFGRMQKPLTLLFAGPSSVGKTETANAIGSALQLEAFVVDCSLMKESHKLSMLTGSAYGYAGSDADTPLIKVIGRTGGKFVLLLDEIEKAHPDIVSSLLGVLGDGVLQDGKGQRHDLKNAVIVATTNAGFSEFDFERDRPGGQESFAAIKKAMIDSRSFPPEILNRFDGLYMYRPLSRSAQVKVASSKLELLINSDHRLDRSRSSADGLREIIADILAEFGTVLPNGRTISTAVEQLIQPRLLEIATGADVFIDPSGEIRPC